MDKVPDRVAEREEKWRQEAADEIVAASRKLAALPVPPEDATPEERVAWAYDFMAATAGRERGVQKLSGLPRRPSS